MKTYIVKHIKESQLQIDGSGTNPLWDKATILTDFCSPWDTEKIKEIEFKALCDDDYLFFCFKVQDSQVYIDTTDSSKASINNSDRVELFFRSDKNLDPYYCLEIDPTPRIMDFKARPDKQFDFDWNWPAKDIEVKSSIKENYFIVEGKISIDSLVKFDLLKDGKIETGIYRAKYNQQKDGSFEPTWITWVNPNTETPNFHTLTSFGFLNLEDH